MSCQLLCRCAQWVLTLPFPLRFPLAFATDVLTVIQRACRDLSLNPHFHTLFLDGVYVRDANDADAPPVFHPAPAPTQDDVRFDVRWHQRRHPLLRRAVFTQRFAPQHHPLGCGAALDAARARFRARAAKKTQIQVHPLA